MSVATTVSVPSPPGLPRSLAGAWDLLRTDPIGLLLPTGGRLLIDVVTALLVRTAFSLGADLLLPTLVLACFARAILGAPLRALTLARAARARGFLAPRLGRPAAVLGVELVTGPLSTLLAAGVGLVGLLAAAEILSEGWIATASVVLAIFTVAAVAVGVLVRAVFATAPMEAVVGGRSALGALVESARSGPRTLATSFALLVIGDALTGFGALLCGALVLPGYPIADLAIAERWLAARRTR